MKQLIHIFSIMLAIAGCAAHAADTNDWGPVTNGLQMSICLEGGKDHVIAPNPVILSVRYTNVSTNAVIALHDYVWMESDDNYSFRVMSPSGKDISPTIGLTLDGSGGIHHLKPGQTLELRYSLSAVCKFDEIGIYKVIATFTNSLAHPPYRVVSNELKIKIEPPQN